MTGNEQRDRHGSIDGGAVVRAAAAKVAVAASFADERTHRQRDSDSVVSVLLVEDQQIYLAGLRALLQSDAGIAVVGEVNTVAAAGAYVDEGLPLVVVVRQGLLQSPDYEPLRMLCCLGVAVLVLAESESELELVRALRAGARGYLSRQLTARQLLDGIRALARDEPAFDSLVARQLVSYMADEPRTPVETQVPSLIDQLTQRQRAVALLVAEGLSNEEIAGRLHVSQATVKSHLGTMMRRLDVRSRTQLAILVNRKEDLPA